MVRKTFTILMVLVISLCSCKKNEVQYDQMLLRGIAWDSLTEQEKTTVTTDWKKAAVETAADYRETRAYSVRFNTAQDALLGPIVVYIDTNTKEILGKGLRY